MYEFTTGNAQMPRRIVLVTIGTLGDLYPYIAVGNALRLRGYDVCIASAAQYGKLVVKAGLTFAELPPSNQELTTDPDVQQHAMHPLFGTEYVIRRLILPYLSETYTRLLAICQGAHFIVGHFLAFAVPLVAERLTIPWCQVYLHPMSLFSAADPSLAIQMPGFEMLRSFGTPTFKLVNRLTDRVTRTWAAPIYALRAELGLARATVNPILHAPDDIDIMGWFPDVLAARQSDWPRRFTITGYPFVDSALLGSSTMPEHIQQFLLDESPLIFTLGSVAVTRGERFFQTSASAVRALGQPALFIGANPAHFDAAATSRVHIVDKLPYDRAFPYAKVVIHHGGIGSVAQALRWGKPMVTVPFAWDQPDNAARIARGGFGKTIPLRAYNTKEAVRVLTSVLSSIDPTQPGRTFTVDGTADAVSHIEFLMQASHASAC